MKFLASASAIALACICSPALSQSVPVPIYSGAQPAGSPRTAPDGSIVYIPWMACTDAANNRISCGGTGGGGGGGASTAYARGNADYIATTAATGYALNDRLSRIVTLDPTTGAVNGAFWVNLTQGTLLASAPTPANLSQLPVSIVGTVTANIGTTNGLALATNQATQIAAEQALAATVGTRGATAPATAQTVQGVDSAGNGRGFLVSTLGVLAAPTAGTAQSTGTVTAVAAATSTTVCPVATNPVVYEVQIYGAAPVLLGIDGQTLTAITPAAGSGAYMLLPTQYTLYVGPVARTNIITAYTATAQTIVCNIVTRQ